MSLVMCNNEGAANGPKNVKVYVRILPLLRSCENCVKISRDKKTIYVRCLQNIKEEKARRMKEPLFWSFKTDGIFYDCSQERIYRETTDNVIDSVLDGANSVLISCGQTGTGKSFTTGGLRNNWEHRGLVPRLFTDLFSKKKRKKDTNKICYSLSYVEFQGKKCRDLLNPNFPNTYNSDSRDLLKRIKNVCIKSEKEALQYIFQGEGRRALSEFSTYPVCHLGTSVITLHVHNTSLITSWAVVSESQIHVVEMAGIDNAGTACCTKAARDVIAANSTKLEIEQYFVNLGKLKRIQSPFARSSGLLRYFGDTLNINSIIRLIGHVQMSREDLGVTLSTLRFVGKIAKLQSVKVTYNIKPQSSMFIEKLQEEIERLRRELYINEMFYQQEATMNVSINRAEQIQHDLLDFLNGKISDFELISFSQIQILTRMIKDLYIKIIAKKEEARNDVEICENPMNNATRITSKTSVQESSKRSKRKNSNSKERPSLTNAEMSAETDSVNKIGALHDRGITLGPGVADMPAISADRISILMKNAAALSLEDSGEDASDESSMKQNSDVNIKHIFENLQNTLKRII